MTPLPTSTSEEAARNVGKNIRLHSEPQKSHQVKRKVTANSPATSCQTTTVQRGETATNTQANTPEGRNRGNIGNVPGPTLHYSLTATATNYPTPPGA